MTTAGPGRAVAASLCDARPRKMGDHLPRPRNTPGRTIAPHGVRRLGASHSDAATAETGMMEWRGYPFQATRSAFPGKPSSARPAWEYDHSSLARGFNTRPKNRMDPVELSVIMKTNG